MKWLLIYMFVHYGGAIEFDSKEACERALTALKTGTDINYPLVRNNEAFCTAKQ